MNQIEKLCEELALEQKNRLRKEAEKYVKNITEEDLLQPNDYPALETNPFFRYEEGVYHGILATQTALQALFKQN